MKDMDVFDDGMKCWIWMRKKDITHLQTQTRRSDLRYNALRLKLQGKIDITHNLIETKATKIKDKVSYNWP